MKKGQKIVVLVMLVFVFMPVFAYAAPSWWPIVPCGLNKPATGTASLPASYYQPCTRCDLFKLVSNIIDFVLIGLMPPIATGLFVWAGFLILMGGANPGWISQGRQIFWTTAMGIAILLASWLITNSIIQSVADPLKVPGPWWQFTCQDTTGTNPPPPTVGPLSITTTSLPDAVVGTDYSQLLGATGGTAPYTFSITAGSLPTGLSLLGQVGGVSGVPTTPGTFTFTVQVQDSSATKQTATKQLSIIVTSTATTLSITTTSLPNAVVGTDYSQSIAATGGTTPYTFSITAGALPTGMSLSQTFGVSGTPTAAGTFTFTIQVQDSSATKQTATKQLSITVAAITNSTVSITTASLSDAVQNKAYSQTISASGGKTPYSWSVSSGTLPAGLSINSSTGTITGTPTATGTFNISIKVSDSTNPVQSSIKQFTIKVVASGIIISNVASSNITNTGATITWTTDVPSTSQVSYGPTTSYGSSSSLNSSLTTSHSVTISGLTAGTTYNYQAVSSITSPTSFTARSSNNTFKTTGTSSTTVVISNVKSVNVTDKSFTITWTTNIPATSILYWGVSAQSEVEGDDINLVINHTVVVTNSSSQTLVYPNITYQFSVESIGADGYRANSSTYTFKTPATSTGGVTLGTCTGVQCKDTSINVCGPVSTSCADSGVNQWSAQITAAAQQNQIGSGVDTIKLVKAIMSQESGGRAGLTSFDGSSFGLMQMQPSTANIYKRGCTTANITTAWLLDSNNAQANICIAINYIKSLFGPCGTEIRNLAAGYNGGGAAKGACQASTSCQSCSICGGTTRGWECPWDGADGVHLVCNVDRRDPVTGQLDNFGQTRVYAPHVAFCYSHF